MDRERIMQTLKGALSEKRLAHTLGVARTAGALAPSFGADPERAELAGLLHDLTREKNLTEQLILCRKYGIITLGEEQKTPVLLHSLTAAVLAREQFGADGEIAAAIACHTTGRVGMTALDKTLCLADYIEPGRQFPGVEELRRAAALDPETALLKALEGTILHIIRRGEYLHPVTVEARNDLLLKKSAVNNGALQP